MRKKYEAMVLGLSPQGLFLLRELSRSGRKTTGVGIKNSIGSFSRYGHIITIDTLSELDTIIAEFVDDETEIHITSDPILNYLIETESRVLRSKRCYPNYQSAIIFADKILTSEFAREIGINCLKTYRIDEINPEEYTDYPSIVKWNKRKYYNEAFKTILLKSSSDISKLKAFSKFRTDLILQKYIAGKPDADVSYGGYFLNGLEKMFIIIKQKRQFPHPNGLTSFVCEYNGEFADQIRSMAIKLMQRTCYSGFVEVECRIDSNEKKLYLIEVNPRACGWIKIIKQKYGNPFTNTPVTNQLSNTARGSWANISRDIRSIVDMLRKEPKALNLIEIFIEYMNNPIKDIFEWTDMRPFFSQLKFFRSSWQRCNQEKNNTINSHSG